MLLTCPICLAEGTRIETPQGPVPVEDLRAAMRVWTFDADGNRVAAPVLRTARRWVPIGHTVVFLQLADGRTLTASAGPPDDRRPHSRRVSAGDTLDGGVVLHAESMPYAGDYVYDILPSGATGSIQRGRHPSEQHPAVNANVRMDFDLVVRFPLVATQRAHERCGVRPPRLRAVSSPPSAAAP